jgi:hypothetical protein
MRVKSASFKASSDISAFSPRLQKGRPTNVVFLSIRLNYHLNLDAYQNMPIKFGEIRLRYLSEGHDDLPSSKPSPLKGSRFKMIKPVSVACEEQQINDSNHNKDDPKDK